MDEDIHKKIAVICPDVYCKKTDESNGEIVGEPREKVKKILKEKGLKEGFKDALAAVKIWKANELPIYNYSKAKEDAMGMWGLKSPMEQHKLIYDSPLEGLEPVYFWLLDFLNNTYKGNVLKLVDNFVSSPGSGHFSEMQGKATQMQQEVSRTLGNVNTVLRSILNLIYDLKEFRLRLKPYESYYDEKTNPEEKVKQLLSLKQIWLDNVDIRKGRGSINALSSGELDFVTLRDAFMALDNMERLDKKPEDGGLDLNDRVKRILQQRGQEFFLWIKESYNSLKQRFELEKNYLKSQMSMLKLYSRWVKPYLKATQKLEQNTGNLSGNAALVTAFNTVLFELKLIASTDYDIMDDVSAGLVPDYFKKVKTRKYFKVLIVEFEFRSIPQRVSQRGDWAYGGRTEIKFTSYALNADEIEVLKKRIESDDLADVFKLIEGATSESIEKIANDVQSILEGKEIEDIQKEAEEKKKKEEEEKKKKGDDFGIKEMFEWIFKFKKKDEPKADLDKGIAPDTDEEKIIRSQTALSSNEACFTTFDTYKKSHGMPSHKSSYDSV